MATPGLRIPVSVSMDQFTQSMDKMGTVTKQVVKQVAKEFISLNAEIAVKGVKVLALYSAELVKVGIAMGALRAASRVAAPIAALGLVVGAFAAVNAITELAKDAMDGYVETLQKAAKADIGVEKFQRLVEAAKQLGSSGDAIEQMFANIRKNMADTLGGSVLAKRLQELQEAGNFQGNQGASDLGRASTTEEQFTALVKLIDEAMTKGERLAALDLAAKFLPPELLQRLQQSSSALSDLARQAEKVASTKIIDEATLAQAADLKKRLDDAHKVLAEKFKPIQDDLIAAGLNYHESWVGIVQAIAQATENIAKFYAILKSFPDIFTRLGNLDFWKNFYDEAKIPEEQRITNGNNLLDVAKQELAVKLKQGEEVKRQMAATEAASRFLRPDVSKPIVTAKAASEPQDLFESAARSVEKHTQNVKADTVAVFENNAVQAQMRAEFSELNALVQMNTGVTREQVNAYEELRKSMGATAALQAAGIQLTAEQSKRFIESSEAIKVATTNYDAAREQLQKLNSASSTIGSALSSAFADAIVEGKKFNEVLGSLLKSLEKAAINSVFASFFNAPSAGGLSPFMSLFKAAEGTDFSPGGLTLVGERGPELMNVPRGAQIIPNHALKNGLGAGNQIVYSPAIDARGASVEAVARLARVLEEDRASFASRTVATIQQARRGRVLGV